VFKEEKIYHREDIYASISNFIKTFLKSGPIGKEKHERNDTVLFLTCFVLMNRHFFQERIKARHCHMPEQAVHIRQPKHQLQIILP